MQIRYYLIASLVMCLALPAAALDSSQGAAAAAKPTAPPQNTAPIARPAEAVQPAPAPVEQARNLQDLLNQYSELFNSKVPGDQIELSRRLWAASARADSPTQQYLILCASRDAAARAGEFTTAWEICDAIVNKFNFSPAAVRTGIFKAGTAALVSASKQNVYFTSLINAIDEALTIDDFTPARQLMALGGTALATAPSDRWAAALDLRQARLDAQAAAYPTVKPAMDLLQQKPADPQSNLLVGKYTCLIKGDWHNGLAYLARGSDIDLRKLAMKDLRDPTDSQQQIEVADDWAALTAKMPEFAQAFENRAYDWNIRALPMATIAEQRKHVEEQLSTLIPQVSRERENAAIWMAVCDSLSHRAYTSTRIAGGTNAADTFSETFQDVPPQGALLVGFHVSLAMLERKQVITFIQPIYITPTGEQDGPSCGRAYSKIQTFRAPDGYAIGAVRVYGGVTLNSVTPTYMRIEQDHLNPDDARKTARIGGPGGILDILDGRGTPVIGICGRQKDGYVGLGLVYSQTVKDD